LEKVSKHRRERALSGKLAATAAVLAALVAVVWFGVRPRQSTKSEPSNEVAATNGLTLQAPETQPSASPVATEPKKDEQTISTANAKSVAEATPAAPSERPKVRKESSSAERPKTAVPSSNKAESVVPASTAKAEAPMTAPDSAACTLNINAIPASRVTLDGRDLGMTPRLGVSVQPGTHVLMVANEGGKKFTTAQCKAGEQKTVVVRLPI
jgi:hypothetical protein